MSIQPKPLIYTVLTLGLLIPSHAHSGCGNSTMKIFDSTAVYGNRGHTFVGGSRGRRTSIPTSPITPSYEEPVSSAAARRSPPTPSAAASRRTPTEDIEHWEFTPIDFSSINAATLLASPTNDYIYEFLNKLRNQHGEGRDPASNLGKKLLKFFRTEQEAAAELIRKHPGNIIYRCHHGQIAYAVDKLMENFTSYKNMRLLQEELDKKYLEMMKAKEETDLHKYKFVLHMQARTQSY